MHIVQLIDTLDRGGAEQACVHLCNGLAAAGHRVSLIATRRGGPLEASLAPTVALEVLQKRSLIDAAAHRQLRELARSADVVHAHSTSVFSAVRALWRSTVPIVWHDHFGGPQRTLPLRLIRSRIAAALVASEPLVDRARTSTGIEAQWFPNAVPEPAGIEPATLAGVDPERHRRIVCVANFRPEKNHIGLLEALGPTLRNREEVRLLLVGAGGDRSTRPQVEAAVRSRRLAENVVLLGERDDVPAILAACEIGVLASHFEAMPLTLLEYGWARLGVVAPAVGQIPQLLGDGQGAVESRGDRENRRGCTFDPGDLVGLRTAVERLLDDETMRSESATRLQRHVAAVHSVEAAVERLEEVYGSLL